jgi:hypothetical protein
LLGPNYKEFLEDPVLYLAKLTDPNRTRYQPKWYQQLHATPAPEEVQDAQGNITLEQQLPSSSVRCVLWLLSQFCVLTPITDPEVITYRYELHIKDGVQMLELDEVIVRSQEKRGMMQCNCRVGMHRGECPHSLGDLIHKGIVTGFRSDSGNPIHLGQRGARGRTRKQTIGAHKKQQQILPAPTFFK